jgi:hypothetical protein
MKDGESGWGDQGGEGGSGWRSGWRSRVGGGQGGEGSTGLEPFCAATKQGDLFVP